MSRARYVLGRIVQTIFLLWVILTFLFFLFKLLPGDLASQLALQGASEEYIEQFRENWGLNDPLHIQYIRFLTNFVTLDYGRSMRFNKPVLEFVRIRIFNSFILIAPALTLSYIIGAALGAVLGTKRGSRWEKFGIMPIIILGSIPGFFLAIILVVVFAGVLNWFPTSGMVGPTIANQYSDAPWWRIYLTESFAMHYVLPLATIVLRYLYIPMLIMRTSVIEISGEDFSYYHKITGLPKLARLKHVAKHGSLPVITNYPLSLGKAVGGLVLIEIVFNWPGIGFTLLQSVLQRDLPTLRFVFFLIALVIVLGNFAVDLLYGYIDPRVSVAD
jgi:peptide/nickel transport system permease protein